MTIKKAWITPFDSTSGLVTLSMESGKPAEEWRRIQVGNVLFPREPTVPHPLRHTVSLYLLDSEDLISIVNAIQGHLNGQQ